MMKSNAEIETDVKSKLIFEPSLDSTKIHVSIKDSIITLFGTVGTFFEKRMAERAVMSVEGVKGVANELQVDLSKKYKRTDTDIAAAAVNALKWDIAVPEDTIKVGVEDGNVTLTGKVDWWYQKNSAEKSIRNLIGVKDVINQIEVHSQVTAKDVKDKILQEFQRNASIDAQKVMVEVDGSRVTLTGSVCSWPEMKEALHGAWSVPGVTRVDNRLIIS